MEERVVVNEVGLRDGLQNQAKIVETSGKLLLLDALLAAGLRHVEAASFVHPKIVPQMADGDQVCAVLPRKYEIDYSVLVPNRKGYERAVAAGMRSIAVVPACSEGMNRSNLNQTRDEAVTEAMQLVRLGRDQGLTTRVYLAVAFACPFDGPTDPAIVEDLTAKMFDAGANEVALADTIGAANPASVARLFEKLSKRHGAGNLSAHFHDTQGLALANAFAALECGVRKFDASVGGLGGCPFAPGATGNVATEDLVNMLEACGYTTGVDLKKLTAAVELAESLVHQPLGGRWVDWQRHKAKAA